MAKSQRLRLGEVRAIYRLLGECRELGIDAIAWRRHMLTELCELFGAQLGTSGAARLAGPRGGLEPIDPVDVGFPSEAARQRWVESQQQQLNLTDPTVQRWSRLQGELTVCTREQLLDDQTWYRSTLFNDYCRVAGYDDALLSFCVQLPQARIHAVSFMRSLGEPRFEERERQLLRLFHAELRPLIGTRLADSDEPGPSSLPPRLRNTLDCLLDGNSEQQAALRLGLSKATVHEYVTTLYRTFGVRSRAELMAYFLRRYRGRNDGELRRSEMTR